MPAHTTVPWDEIEQYVWQVMLEAVEEQGPRSWVPRALEVLKSYHVTSGNQLAQFKYRTMTNERRALWEDAVGRWKARTDVPASTPRAAAAAAVPPRTTKPEPMDATHPDLRRAERRAQELEERNRTLERKLKAADADTTAFERAAEVIRRHADTVALPYVPLRVRELHEEPEHVVEAVAALSDEHADEVVTGASTWGVERFDFSVFRARLQQWSEAIGRFATTLLPKHRIERLWVFKLGDSIHGDIHDAKHRNHFANSVRAALATGDAEAQAIAALAPLFPGGVHVVGVSGNHPRLTKRKDYDDPHDNLDFLVLTQMATRLHRYIGEGAVTVHAPRSYSAYVDVAGSLCALNHGDDVRGTWGIPWYGFARREGRVQNIVARHDAHVRYFYYGHYHTYLVRQDGDGFALHNGAFTATSGYATEAHAVGNEPVQRLDLYEAGRGLVLPLPLFVRNPEREERLHAGEWTPDYGEETVLTEVGAPDLTAAVGNFPVIRAEPRTA